MKFLIAPDALDAKHWLAKNPLEPGEPFSVLVDAEQAESLCMYEEELIWINRQEIQQELIDQIESNIKKFAYLRRKRDSQIYRVQRDTDDA